MKALMILYIVIRWKQDYNIDAFVPWKFHIVIIAFLYFYVRFREDILINNRSIDIMYDTVKDNSIALNPIIETIHDIFNNSFDCTKEGGNTINEDVRRVA